MSAPTPSPHPTDEALRRAADGLRRGVASDSDTHAALDAVRSSSTPRTGHRLPWLAAAAAALALVVGAALVVAGRDTPEEVTVDHRPSTTVTSPVPEGPAVGGPTDGEDSLDLPVTATPSTDLHPGDTVTVTGEGFNPGEPVGVVQCTMDVVESSAGSAACDLGVLGIGGTPDAEGRVTGSIALRQIIQISGRKVDCAADGARCAVAIGQVSDYDVSGAAEIVFAEDVPPVAAPVMTVTPATGLRHGDTVTVTIDGATEPLYSLQLCAVPEQEGGVDPYGPGDQNGVGCVYELLTTDQYDAQPVDGRVTFQARLWRAFSEGGSEVVDCADRRCALYAFSAEGMDPAPAVVDFDPDGPMPVRPHIEASPTAGLRPGDQVSVTVTGLDPGTPFNIGACADLAGTGSVRDQCAASVVLQAAVAGDDGSWTGPVELPSPQEYGVDCTREWSCALTLSYGSADGVAPPVIGFLPPEPVTIVFAG